MTPHVLLLALVLTFAPMASAAQAPVLIADTVTVSADGSTFTATGNVEVLSGGRRLRADGLVFDEGTDELAVIGPLTVVNEDGTIMTGESAVLTTDLRRGIIRGIRILMDGNTQIAAVEMHRADGRYLQLFKTVTSSCSICEERSVPFWGISAKRVIHDQVRQQLFFHDARLEIAGIPILYVSRLRLPDPALERATGFLIPKLKSSTNLGTGVKVPYFVTLGDHADLLLTPYLSSRTKTVEGRFRRELSFGSLQLQGAVTDDDLRPGNIRSHLFAKGGFDLPRDFDLNFDLGLVSDHSYLWIYDYSDADRLNSSVELTRSGRDEYVSASVAMLEEILGGRRRMGIDDKLYQGTTRYQRRIWPAAVGGEIQLTFDAEISKAPLEPERTGKDRIYRAGARAGWLRSWTLDNGLVASARGQLAADARTDSPDGLPRESDARLIPSTALELRWPHIMAAEGNGTDFLEPAVQIAWTDDEAGLNDIGLDEFDEGNLLALGHFQKFDRYERDWRAAVGLGWTRLALDGGEYAVTAGKLFRGSGGYGNPAGTGLSDNGNEWLLSARAKRDRVTVSTRSLFDDSSSFSRFETQFAWKDELTSASGRYIWASGLPGTPGSGATPDTSEIILDASRIVYSHWTVSVNGKYDGAANRTTRAGFGMTYKNECVTVDFSATRRFSSSGLANVPASTDFAIGVSLGGFSRKDSGPERSCRIRR